MSGHLALYVAASMALILTPGQDMIYVIGRSLAQGRVAGLCSVVGAAYLVYLGIRMITTREVPIDARAGAARSSPAWLVLQGVLSNVTNPKIILFFFAFLPQFVDPASPHPTRDLVFLGVLYAMLGLPVKCGVALLAARLSQRMLQRPRALVWMNRACGAVLVALGVRLARG